MDTGNPNILQVVTSSFESTSEEIKQAASFALGSISFCFSIPPLSTIYFYVIIGTYLFLFLYFYRYKRRTNDTKLDISVGNLQKYLPFVLNEIKTQPKRQYLLLHSLREVWAEGREDGGGRGRRGRASVLVLVLSPLLCFFNIFHRSS